jgi:hypothetical protein
MSTLASRGRKGTQIGGKPAIAGAAVFDSTTGATAVGLVTDADVLLFKARFPDLDEVGEVGVDEVEGTAGNATHEITVPAGKYWRLIAMFSRIVADANAADRIVTFLVRDADDATLDTLTLPIATATDTDMQTTLFALTNVGDAENEASTMDYPTAGVLLTPGENILVSVADGVAGDSLDTYLFYIQFDSDPR